MTSPHKNIFFLAGILFVLLLVAYANHFNNGFHFDDLHTIVDNLYIRNLKNIPSFFTDPRMFSASPENQSLRPIVTTSLAIDYWLGNGLTPFFFHLSGFVWHILLCITCYFIFVRLFKKSFDHSWTVYFSLFAVAWFALHTANAETLNYIISRSDIISTFFITASFGTYVLFPSKRKWHIYIIPAVIAALTKETAVVLVILLFFYIHLFEHKLAIIDMFKIKNAKLVLNTIVTLLPLIVIVGAVQYYTIASSQITSANNIPHPFGYYLLTQSFVWLHYFVSFFLPIHLSADTDWTVILSVVDKRILIGLLFVGVLFFAIFKTSKKAETRPISFGLIWFVAALLPTSLMPFAEVTNDHRMYFAFVGLAFSVVGCISLFLIRKEKSIITSKVNQMLIITTILVILTLNAYGVSERNKVWFSDESLWHDVTIKSPLNGRGLMNYGLSLSNQGLFAKALYYFKEAQKLTPTYSRVYTNMGIAQAALGKYKEAETNFIKGMYYGSGLSDSYVYYARFLVQRKRYEEAKKMGERALLCNPQSMVTLNLLMEVYQYLGLWVDLERTAVMALAILPSNELAQNYLNAAKTKNNTSQISPSISRKLTAVDYLNLSLAYYNTGDFEKCILYCEEAIALKPDYADAYSNMAASYNQLKNWKKGIEASKKALAIDPNHKFAKGNLEWALREKL
ncbi:tetratricopeptide repeat protein [Pedobacter sp. Du54]|uniref:tetratricopeptide repeat protein n=1 Tax=Pedobacter anseongensis TaxID=3133439 RepID=UPI0030A2A05B